MSRRNKGKELVWRVSAGGRRQNPLAREGSISLMHSIGCATFVTTLIKMVLDLCTKVRNWYRLCSIWPLMPIASQNEASGGNHDPCASGRDRVPTSRLAGLKSSAVPDLLSFEPPF